MIIACLSVCYVSVYMYVYFVSQKPHVKSSPDIFSVDAHPLRISRANETHLCRLDAGRQGALRVTVSGPPRRRPSLGVAVADARWTRLDWTDRHLVVLCRHRRRRSGSGPGAASSSAGRAEGPRQLCRGASDEPAPASRLGRHQTTTATARRRHDETGTRTHVSSRSQKNSTSREFAENTQGTLLCIR